METKSKIVVLIPVYNNNLFIYKCLEQFVNDNNIADHVVLIEGSWNPDLPSRSTDGTVEAIRRFQSDYKSQCDAKYTFLEYNASQDLSHPSNTYNPKVLGNELVARQTLLDNIPKDKELNWAFFVDSDEFYLDQDQVKNLKSYLDNYLDMPDITFRIPAFVFYFNSNFGTEEYFKRINKLYNSELYTRHMDYTDGLIHRFKKDGQMLTDKAEALEIDIDPDILYMFHYGYIREDMESKLNMWQIDDNQKDLIKDLIKNPGKINTHNNQNYHIFNLKFGYGSNQKWGLFKEISSYFNKTNIKTNIL